jgi:hypothetical protein
MVRNFVRCFEKAGTNRPTGTAQFTRRRAVLLHILLTTGIAVPSFAQSENISPELPGTNSAADTFYALFDINASNLVLNFGDRLANASFANVTFKTIAQNLYPGTWFWETGDRFLVNQFGHPYQGSAYFSSARVNGFNFYRSIPFAFIGSLQWEIVYEPNSSINDVITTTIGGISLGEMLHRLFLEVDESPSAGAKIGSFFISPVGRFNAIFNRPKLEKGVGAMYRLSFNAGFEKSFAHFAGHQTEALSWQSPGMYAGANVIYGDPFTQEILKPYDQFEASADFATNIASYNMRIISDGYLFSLTPSRTPKTDTSTGLTMHYDFFNATNNIIDNVGHGNIQFSSNAIDWTVKHAYSLSEQTHFSVKAHAGLVLWGTSMYNDTVMSETYLRDTRSTYGIGENLKLFFTVTREKTGTLELAATGYHISNIPVTASHSTGNVFFLNCSATYDFPLNEHIGIGATLRYWNLWGQYDAAENIHRTLASAGAHTSFRF